jgi:hypothetical protein
VKLVTATDLAGLTDDATPVLIPGATFVPARTPLDGGLATAGTLDGNSTAGAYDGATTTTGSMG